MPFALDSEHCNGRQKAVAQHNATITRLLALTVGKELSRSALGQVAFGLESYRQAAIYRLRVLVRGVCSEFNGSNLMCAVILSRQLVETAVHFIATHEFVKKQLNKKPPDRGKLYDKVMQSLFGSNLDGHGVMIKPEQILNCVDASDKLVRKLMPEVAAKERRPIRSSYDFLSELVHPNCYAFLFHLDFEAGMARDRVGLYPDGSKAGRVAIVGNIFRAMLILDIVLLCEREMATLVSTLDARTTRSNGRSPAQ